MTISDGFDSFGIYDKRDDFDFDIVNLSFLHGDVPRDTSYGVYISQHIRLARMSSHVADIDITNGKNKSKFYRRHYRLYSHLSLTREWPSIVARRRIIPMKFEQYSGLTQ